MGKDRTLVLFKAICYVCMLAEWIKYEVGVVIH